MQAMAGEKFFRKSNRLSRRKKPARNKHHLTNICKGGKSTTSNLLNIRTDRHASIHRYFRNLSWEEIGDALFQMFGLRDPQKCYNVIRKISQLKGRVA